jgi:uncharacterized protein
MEQGQLVEQEHLGLLLSVAPAVPTSDMGRTVAHYQHMGFTFTADGDQSPEKSLYTIAQRDDIELHFAVQEDHHPSVSATCLYFTVASVDRMLDEMVSIGEDQHSRIRKTDYGVRQFSHTDPDGNVLIFAEPMHTFGGPEERMESDNRWARALTFVLQNNDLAQLRVLLADWPSLAECRIDGRTPLHIYAEAPGPRRNPRGVVDALMAARCDLDAHTEVMGRHETALHCAASNDDVDLIAALLDAGADIEHPGSSVDGGPAISSALAGGQWEALRVLWERGAKAGLSHCAALGELDLVIEEMEADPGPDDDELGAALWNACRAGQLQTAQYLVEQGANHDWKAPGSGETPLGIALLESGRDDLVLWLSTLQ